MRVDLAPAPDLAGPPALAGADPTLVARAPQDAMRGPNVYGGSYCSWTVDHASWVVTPQSPAEHGF